MEYCSGGSLSEAEPFWRGSPAVALRVFQEICDGVAYAHSQNIIHRDLKPENIFLRTKGGPLVVGDFGICFLEEDGERITLTEEAVGSRLFIAPELEDGRVKDVSSASDVYSLGKILYWLLSGGTMFSRERHREEKWDLKIKDRYAPLGWSNVYMEHANRLLDFMIIHDPDQRINIRNVLLGIKDVSRLIQKEYNPISKDIKQPCTYCGYGVYHLQAATSTDVRNFGFQTVGNSEWRIFTCSECGHVQAFRIDLAKKKRLVEMMVGLHFGSNKKIDERC